MTTVAGRAFDDRDRAGQPRVMLVNQALARSGFLGENPIGRTVYTSNSTPFEIVGIVDDVRQFSLIQDPDPQIFIDFRQVDDAEPLTGVGLYFGVRIDGASTPIVASIRSLVRQLDARAMVETIAPMEQLVSNSIARPRLYAVMLNIFAAIAVVLAATGIYGVIAFAVAQRTREIAVRMALGATQRQVIGLVLGQSLTLTIAGMALGLGAAALVTRYLEQLLFGLTPVDPATFIAVFLAFALVAVIAAFIPARRAANVDPLIALRAE
jgi:putative ABC transport system permease protein